MTTYDPLISQLAMQSSQATHSHEVEKVKSIVVVLVVAVSITVVLQLVVQPPLQIPQLVNPSINEEH